MGCILEAVGLLLMNLGGGVQKKRQIQENPDFLGSGDLAISEFNRGPDWSQ